MYINNRSRSHRQSGASMLELVIVIVIIVIVATIAFLQRGTSNVKFKRQTVAQQLKVSLERARFDSVKRRAQAGSQANVVIDTSSYALTTYPINTSGVPTLKTSTISTTGENVVMVPNGSITLPYTIYLNQRGEAVDSAGSSISPSFYVCQAPCSSHGDSNANLILVTPTGTVNLLPGGSSVPNFNSPPVTTVPPTTGINNTVQVP